jgi:hypothetical protein
MINEGYLLLLHINLQQVFAIFFNTIIIGDLLSDPTIVIIIEVVVEELCSRTVTNTPIIKPATGLDNILFSWNAFPAVFPVNHNDSALMFFSQYKYYIFSYQAQH